MQRRPQLTYGRLSRPEPQNRSLQFVSETLVMSLLLLSPQDNSCCLCSPHHPTLPPSPKPKDHIWITTSACTRLSYTVTAKAVGFVSAVGRDSDPPCNGFMMLSYTYAGNERSYPTCVIGRHWATIRLLFVSEPKWRVKAAFLLGSPLPSVSRSVSRPSRTQMTWGRQQCSEQMWAQHLTLAVRFKGHLHSEI